MQPVTNQVEYIFPEHEFGIYPDVEEVSDANIAGNWDHSIPDQYSLQ